MQIVVTGASRGIGLELTKQALEKKSTVLAIARNPKDSKGLQELLKKYPETLQTLQVDLQDPEAMMKISSALKGWKQVDVLINNAGIYQKGETTEDFLKSFHVNSVIPYFVTKTLFPKLKKSQNPKVIQISSLMGSVQDNRGGGSTVYRSSKAALNMINKNISLEEKDIVSIVMHPGWVKTDMGGAGAAVEVLDSAAGIWKVIDGLTLKDSGSFIDFQGKHLPY